MWAWGLSLQMDGIHPKFVLSKRFPVHAAIEQLNLHALKVRTESQTAVDQQISVWCSGSVDSSLRRQIPFWSEVDQHRHLRAPPGLHQPASLWSGNPGHCEALHRPGSSCQWSGLYWTNSTVLRCQECFDKRVLQWKRVSQHNIENIKNLLPAKFIKLLCSVTARETHLCLSCSGEVSTPCSVN